MRVFFFDTETAGLPKARMVAQEGAGNWAAPVSISWIILEENKQHETKSYLIRPKGWIIPDDSIKIHKITNERAESEGYSLDEVITEFNGDLSTCDAVVAHNFYFDKNTILSAAMYLCSPMIPIRWPRYQICTMEASRNICCLPFANPRPNDRFKPPQLKEFYQHCFGHPPPDEMLHSSLGDVQIMIQCFFKHWTLSQIEELCKKSR
jgi:DNA polymerase III epsilon subunit-like protein